MPFPRSLVLVFALAAVPTVAAEPLTQQLLREPVAQLAQAARERGDAGRGAVLFFQPFLTCARCHDAETGTQLGPDIAKAGKEGTAEYLIESVLLPSKVIKKGYEPLTVALADGRTVTGLLAEEKPDAIILLDPAGGKRVSIPTADIDKRTTGKLSLMPDGLVNLLSDRQQFLDLAKYLIEVAEQGPNRAKELRPAHTALVIPEYEKDIDHAGLIRGLDAKAFQRGEAIYTRVCANCHGTKDQPGSLPTSPKFAAHVFKNGSDPYSLYQTLTRGYDVMAPQTWMVPRQKYDVIHYLREMYLKPHNVSQYAKTDAAYLAKLPKGTTFGPAPVKVEPWVTMDYGPSLMNTYEVGGTAKGETPNIAYKGIAMRLDAGAGGVSRGKRWALFDHDTMRYAAGWTGTGFIDWKGIHFNGQHQVHPKLVGGVAVANPVGPGWADPKTGSFEDPRPLGRDKRPYGPLPREWARFKGTYAYGDRTILSYTVGDAAILELDGVETDGEGGLLFTRTLDIGKSNRDLQCRLAPKPELGRDGGVNLKKLDSKVSLVNVDKFWVLKIPAAATPTRVKVTIFERLFVKDIPALFESLPPPQPLKPLTVGGPKRWPEVLKTTVAQGKSDGPFAVDTFELPTRNPWNAQLRLTGFDFTPDGKSMAVCSWDGDVWMVRGIDNPEAGLTWQRIASGLFQPLGLKFRDGDIFVCCRDQIVKLHDLNGDGETDFYECFNSDHQVTEHFHEFAMGLQTDAEGNFYYAKSGRHALPALVPHHGTLLKVSKDGATTEILATGFRAANGVCLNPDGTFFVTDQEGFWTPKNRINKVEKGGFYGNLYGYTDITDTSDSAMKQPLCWITNAFDRSPAELVWVPKHTWGPLGGALLNTSYGMGKIFVVPHETVNGQPQGGMCALPLPTFPTGVMRPRFHPTDGQLYVCGMFAWAGNQHLPGGFYRVRYTGKPADLPVGLKATPAGVELTFTDALDPKSAADPKNYSVKVWGLKRTKNYGSKHIGEKPLAVTTAAIGNGDKTVSLTIPDLAPTWGMEIQFRLNGADGRPVTGTIHNTIHEMPPAAAPVPAPYAKAVDTLTELIEHEMKDKNLPAMSIALVDDQRVVWAKGFGFRDRAGKVPADANTVYRVGSVSKLFTDVAVMRLVEEGKLDLDKPVTDYLPDFKPVMPAKAKPITLRMLMSHRSGLLREPPVGNYFDPTEPTLAKTVASMNGLPLVYPPGAKEKYSNAAIGVVGYVLEKTQNERFEKYVQQRVLDPLGMNTSSFLPTDAVKKNLADAVMWTYHGREFPAPTFELGMAPAGCMYSTVLDLAKFQSALFAGKAGLKPATFEQMFTPQFAAKDAKSGFGLGFYLSQLDGHKKVGHGGAIYGFATQWAALPADKLGVVVVCSRDVANAVMTRIGDTAFKLMLAAKAGKPLPKIETSEPFTPAEARALAGKYQGKDRWFELTESAGRVYLTPDRGLFRVRLRKLGDSLISDDTQNFGTFRFTRDGTTLVTASGVKYEKQPPAAEPPPEPPTKWKGLIGEYGWDHNTLYIYERNGQLHALVEWVEIDPLTEESENVFAFPTGQGMYQGEKIVFTRDKTGRATVATMASVPFVRRKLDGENGETFRVTPTKPVAELRKAALAAKPPKEAGDFRKPDLVDLATLPGLKFDLRYATDNNFLGTPVYSSAKAFFQRSAADSLGRVAEKLKARGLGLLIFDSYRPWHVTKMFWDGTDPKHHDFVADPAEGSRHNRGCAVDLGLYHLKTGKPVAVVSGFDEFSDRAYPDYPGGTSRERWHRDLLRRTMEAEGFTVYSGEWWHFDYKDWRKYPILNATFEELAGKK